MGPGTTFHRLLWDDAQSRPGEKIKLEPDDKIRRVVLCTGKVYYDLYEAREAAGIDDVYLLRVEQLYPFPARALITELSRFPQAEIVWCAGGAQEHGRLELHRAQPRVGAGAHRGAQCADRRYVGRAGVGVDGDGASPASTLHEQKTLVEEALNGPDGI